MEIRPKKSNKKGIIIAAIVAVVVITGGFLLYRQFVDTTTDTDIASNTSSSNQSSNTGSSSSSTNTASSSTTSASTTDDGNKTPKQYEGDNPNTSESLTGSINYINVADGKLSIRTTIDQYLSSGSCVLTMTGPQGQSYSDTTTIEAAASTSSCHGFDESLERIDNTSARSGKWTIKIELTSGDKTGTLTGEVEL